MLKLHLQIDIYLNDEDKSETDKLIFDNDGFKNVTIKSLQVQSRSIEREFDRSGIILYNNLIKATARATNIKVENA